MSQKNGLVIKSNLGRQLGRARATPVSCVDKFGPVCADCNTLLVLIISNIFFLKMHN